MQRVRAFTLVELLAVVAVMLVLLAIGIPSLRFFQQESDLDNSAEEMVSILRIAHNKTLASEGPSAHGVFFDTATAPQQYVLFRGETYASNTFSQTYRLPSSVGISFIDLAGGSEVVFTRVAGNASPPGSVILSLQADPTKTRTVSIENAGIIHTTSFSLPSDAARVKDSRHVHFDYAGRVIDTATEKIVIEDGFTPVEIVIANNMQGGQIQWEGEVNAGGEIQKLKIHTHRLNDMALGTQFCIHRDRRYNNKHIRMSLSGDASGDIIQYADNGDTTSGTSIYVSTPNWQ